MKLDFITVVCREELMLLQIQAQSFDRYLQPSLVGNIHVIVNDEQSVMEDIRVDWWGTHQQSVKIQHRSDLGLVVQPHIQGWYTQQICKLLAASVCANTWNIIFDAKTWLVKHFKLSDLFDDQEKPIVGTCVISPYWQDSREYFEKLYDVNISEMLGPAGVPFVAHTLTTEEIVTSVPYFGEWFQNLCPGPGRDKMLVTEFMLYTAYLYRRDGGFNKLYSTQTVGWHPNNLADWQTEEFEHFFERGTLPTCLTVSIHRRCFSKLTNEQINRWLDFLETKKIIKSEQRNYVDSYRK